MKRIGLLSTLLVLSVLVACGDDGGDAGNAGDGDTGETTTTGGTSEGGGSGEVADPPDSGASPYEKAAQAIVDTLDGAADVIGGVTDSSTADAAVKELNAARDRLKDLYSQLSTLSQTPTPELDALKATWTPKIKTASKRVSSALEALPRDPRVAMKIAPAVASLMTAQATK